MELIFDSIDERDTFFVLHCPCCVDGKLFEKEKCKMDRRVCKKCWEQSGVKYRVKGPTPDYPVSIEEQMKIHHEQQVKASVWNAWTMMNPGDKLVKSDFGWRIEKQEKPEVEIIYVVNDPLKPGDKIVKRNGVWGVERRPEPTVIRMTHNPYMDVESLYPKTILDEHWMDKKVEGYIREVTRGDIQMFVMPGRHQGKTEMYRQVMEELAKTKGDRHSDIDKLDALTYSYNYTKWRETLDIFMDKHDRIKKPQIEKVIFNNPATIVYWKDGTKTVVKIRENDIFDEEKGLAMAICKKVFGNEDGYWSENFKEWVSEKKKQTFSQAFIDEMYMIENERRLAQESPLDKINERNKTRACVDCKSYEKDTVEEPCCRCDAIEHDKFEEKVVEHCKNCQYRPVSPWHAPCKGCIYNRGTEDHFKPMEKKEVKKCCTNCIYLKVKYFDDPCCLCKSYSNFEAADK